MLDRDSTRRLALAAAAGCGLAMLALPTQMALAQDDDAPFEQRFLRGILGGNRPGIDYRERSPLVIPPSTDLPAPEAVTGVAPVPNWPNDPDAARRKRASVDGNAPATDAFERDSRPLTPSEMRRGRTRQSARASEPVRTPSDSDMIRPLTPAEMGETKSVFGWFSGGGSDKPVTFAGEPDRSRMIDPPPGYRTPAPTQPYAPPKDSGSWFKPFNWFDRGTGLER